MGHIINGIKDKVGLYKLDSVNCFERPVAMIYNYLRPGSDNLYLMYRKLFQSFHICNDLNELRDYEKEIGVKCCHVSVKEDIVNQLIKLISDGHPVIVPGNLRELYYSSHYKLDNWGHPFLIKGYDEERKIFYIMDCIQNSQGTEIPCLNDFAMTFEQLQTIFHAYQGICEGHIYYFEVSREDRTLNERLIDFLKVFYDLLCENKYIEYDVIQKLESLSGTDVNTMDSAMLKVGDDMINTPKYRVVILEQLILCMKSLSYDTCNLAELMERLSNAWEIDNLMFMKCLRKADFSKVIYRRSKNTEALEQELMQEIKKCIVFVKNTKLESEMDDCKIIYENNEDGIVKYEGGQYIFRFTTGKIYNTWLFDNCPKVLLYNGEPSQEMNIQVKCSIIKDFKRSGHQEGIFIRTDTDELYMFGLDFQKKYLLDCVKKSNIDFFLNNEDIQQCQLFLRYGVETLSIGTIDVDGEWNELGHYEMNIKIKQAGIFCKTWDDCKSLEIVFSDVFCEANRKL